MQISEITVVVENTLEDLDAYYDYFLQTDSGKKYSRNNLLVQQAVFVFLLLMIFFLMRVIALFSSPLSETLTFVVIIFLLVEFLYFWRADFHPRDFYAKQALRSFRQKLPEREKKILFLPKECRVEKEGFSISYSEARHFWKWTVIENIGRTAEHVFIEISRFYAYTIPRRAFATEQDFETFWETVEELYKTTRDQAPETPILNVEIKPKKVRTRVKVLAVMLFIILCCGSLAGIDALFSKALPYLPPVNEIQDVLDEYMRAMSSKDIDQAINHFYSSDQETRDFISEQVKGDNFALYEGYQSLDITDFHIEYGEPGVAQISANIKYHENLSGDLFAQLETLNGQWKIVSVNVYAPPAKIKQFLQSP